MDNEMNSRINGFERLGVPPDTSADLVFLMCVVVEMTVTDDIVRLSSLIDYSDSILGCIQSDCLSRLICKKE